jgi:hypothetical protein
VVFMPYVPDWERLSDALKPLVIASVSENNAKLDISRAIADKKIRVRLTVAIEPDVLTAHLQMVAKVQGLGSDPKHSVPNVECFEDANVKIPSQLMPDDFDWENSRPLQPWPFRWRGGRRDEWQLPSQPALLIELRTVDLLSWIETCSEPALSGQGTSSEAQHEDSGAGLSREVTSNKAHDKAAQGSKTLGILEAIEQLWPDGMPKGLTAKDRNKAILDRLVNNGSSIPRAIERAVQRALRFRRPK